MTRPDFWQNRERREETSRKAGELRKEIEEIERLERELAALEELSRDEGSEAYQEELLKITRALGELEKTRFLSGPYDRNAAVLFIQAGAGGDDAEDWAAMLFRMYERQAQHQGWKVKVLHCDWGAEHGRTERAGIKTLFAQIEGSFAYGLLKGEHGVHRLVRISPFSGQKLRHTSFALVEVVPVLKEVDARTFEVPAEDIKFEAFRSSGPGGQNVNRRATAVRLVHLPTGISVACQVERTQEANRRRAYELLKARLFKLMEEVRVREIDKLRGKRVSPEWGNQIRSYILHPYTLVKDHRTGIETSDVERVLDGEIDEFIEAELRLVSRK